MKKSTIFFVILTYIISFLVVGLFGISVRVFNPTVYVDKIVVSAPPQEAQIFRKVDESEEIEKYLFYTPYTEQEITIMLKASVEPAEATISDLKLLYDTSVQNYTVTQNDNVFFYVTMKNLKENDISSSSFTIETSDGEKKQCEVCLIVSTDLYNNLSKNK